MSRVGASDGTILADLLHDRKLGTGWDFLAHAKDLRHDLRQLAEMLHRNLYPGSVNQSAQQRVILRIGQEMDVGRGVDCEAVQLDLGIGLELAGADPALDLAYDHDDRPVSTGVQQRHEWASAASQLGPATCLTVSQSLATAATGQLVELQAGLPSCCVGCRETAKRRQREGRSCRYKRLGRFWRSRQTYPHDLPPDICRRQATTTFACADPREQV